jgi:hypothetical protein
MGCKYKFKGCILKNSFFVFYTKALLIHPQIGYKLYEHEQGQKTDISPIFNGTQKPSFNGI